MTLLKALDTKIPDSYLCTAFLCDEAERLTPHWFSTNLQKYIYPELKQLKQITIKLSIEQRSTFEEPNSFTSDLSIKVFGKIVNILRCMLYTLQTQQAQVFEIKDINMCHSRIKELMSPLVNMLYYTLWALQNIPCILESEQTRLFCQGVGMAVVIPDMFSRILKLL